MRYLVLTQPSEAYAASISALLFALSRPPSVRGEDDVSLYYCGWVVHPSSGEVALALPEVGEAPIPVHVDADAEALVDAVRPALAPGEADALEAAINDQRGQAADVLLFVPASAQSRLMARGEAEAAGWFGVE